MQTGINNTPKLNKTHRQVYNSNYPFCYDRLLKYGKCFIEDSFVSGSEQDIVHKRPPLTLWDRTLIWKNLPEISYAEVMESDRGLSLWLEMFHRYGIAVMRDVPATQVGYLYYLNFYIISKTFIFSKG